MHNHQSWYITLHKITEVSHFFISTATSDFRNNHYILLLLLSPQKFIQSSCTDGTKLPCAEMELKVVPHSKLPTQKTSTAHFNSYCPIVSLWGHPASYQMETRGPFTGGKVVGVWSWPVTSTLHWGLRMPTVMLTTSRQVQGNIVVQQAKCITACKTILPKLRLMTAVTGGLPSTGMMSTSQLSWKTFIWFQLSTGLIHKHDGTQAKFSLQCKGNSAQHVRVM